MKIFLAAGHGGTDPGSVANNTTEAKECIDFVHACANILRQKLPTDYEIILVPDEFYLQPTVDFINKYPGVKPTDLCIEVHMNSNAGTPGSGVETYYGYQKLAASIQNRLAMESGLPNRGVKLGNDLMFNNATIPGSALVEVGFINNIDDLIAARKYAAAAIADGLIDFIKPALTPTPQPKPDTTDWQQKYLDLQTKIRKTLADVIRVASANY